MCCSSTNKVFACVHGSYCQSWLTRKSRDTPTVHDKWSQCKVYEKSQNAIELQFNYFIFIACSTSNARETESIKTETSVTLANIQRKVAEAGVNRITSRTNTGRVRFTRTASRISQDLAPLQPRRKVARICRCEWSTDASWTKDPQTFIFLCTNVHINNCRNPGPSEELVCPRPCVSSTKTHIWPLFDFDV